MELIRYNVQKFRERCMKNLKKIYRGCILLPELEFLMIWS